MAQDEDDDLYDEEFDFVDDDDDDEADDSDTDRDEDASDLDDESPLAEEGSPVERSTEVASRSDDRDAHRAEDRSDENRGPDERGAEDRGDEEPVDEYGRPEPAANYVVHVYEYKKFKRTIDRPFTPEDAEAFATEFNRTGKSYGRVAVSGKNDAKPKKSLD